MIYQTSNLQGAPPRLPAIRSAKKDFGSLDSGLRVSDPRFSRLIFTQIKESIADLRLKMPVESSILPGAGPIFQIETFDNLTYGRLQKTSARPIRVMRDVTLAPASPKVKHRPLGRGGSRVSARGLDGGRLFWIANTCTAIRARGRARAVARSRECARARVCASERASEHARVRARARTHACAGSLATETCIRVCVCV